MKSFIGSAILGMAMAVVMVGLLIFVLWQNHLYSIYVALWVGIGVLGPLLLANLVFSAVYIKRQAPSLVYLWMWGPSFAVLAGIWLIASFMQIKDETSEAAHPNIREVHINLSGRSLWLDPESTVNDSAGAGELAGNRPGSFISFTRYAKDYYGKDRMFAYAGSRLSADFKSLRVFHGKPAETSPTMLPVLVAAPYPDLTSFMDRHQIAHLGEASVLVYHYYHYADRVEIAPALRLSGLQAMDLWGRKIPVVAFHLANLRALPLARLEIDGQAVDLGGSAFARESADSNGCTSRNYQAHVVNELSRPLKVRWQFAQPDPRWHETMVSVPEFGSARRPSGRAHSTSVDLYFQDDGSVVAERSLEIDQAQQKLTLLTTGLAEPLRQTPPCGTAADRYTEQVSIIQDRGLPVRFN